MSQVYRGILFLMTHIDLCYPFVLMNRLRLYLQYCFKGKAFPKGDSILPEERLPTLRPELFHLLFREFCQPPSSQLRSRNHSASGIRSLSYPYLRALLLVDAKALLDCLSLVFDDHRVRFTNPAASQVHAVEYETDHMVSEMLTLEADERDNELLPERQDLVDILSSIIMSDSLVGSSYHLGSRRQMALLSIRAKNFFLDFLAKYLKLGVISAPKYLCGEVFIRLCNKKGAMEGDIVSLLHALPRSSYELDEVLYTVERVQMTRAALFLHKVGVTISRDRDGMAVKCQHHFNRSLNCYLKDEDEDFRNGVFAYARKECSGGNVTMLKNVILQRLPELVKLSSVSTAHLVGEIFIEEFDLVMSSLKGIESGRVEYDFLSAIISGDLGKFDPVLSQELLANLTMDHHHSYLLLMMTFQPDSVYQYLSSTQHYRLNDALKLCQERNITDASAYLLERMGDVSGALKLMLEALDQRMMTLGNVLHQSRRANAHSSRRGKSEHPSEAGEVEISRIKLILSAILDLCERNKNDHLTLDNERGPLLWFHVLDRLIHAKSLPRLPKNSAEATSVEISALLSDLLLMTMQRMISNVSLYELMQKITKDHAGSDLGEFREMLVSMLKTYSSELNVCSSAVDVMYNDIRRMSHEKKRLKVQGSFVKEFPAGLPKRSFLDVGPAGNVELRSPRGVRRSTIISTGRFSDNNVGSLLKQRRKSERLHARNRQRGYKHVNFSTASECGGVQDMPGERHVGILSDAQHIGGL